MQFSIIAALGLSAFVAAAPHGKVLETRTNDKVCCPSGQTYGCSPCTGSTCPSGTQTYNSCSFVQQVGAANLFLCNVLNNNDVSVPVTVSLPTDVLGGDILGGDLLGGDILKN